MKLAKVLTVILSITLLIGVFGGCGAQQKEPSGTETSSTGSVSEAVSTSKPEEKKMIEITLLNKYDVERTDRLLKATEVVNQKLKEENKNTEIKLIVEKFDGNRQAFRSSLVMRYNSKDEFDMVVHNHSEITYLKEAGMLRTVDDIMAMECYSDVYEPVKKSVQLDGGVYGIPTDNECRVFFYTKSVLKKLGYDEQFIEQLPEKVRKGEIILQDIIDIATESVAKGYAKYGYTHRPNAGPSLPMIANAFGCNFYDESTKKMVLEKDKLEKTFAFFYDNVYKYKITPAESTMISWDDLELNIWPSEQSTFFCDGIYEKPYVMDGGDYTSKQFDEKFGAMLCPATEKGGKPLTLSDPCAWMVINTVTDDEYNAIKLILEEVAQPKYDDEFNVATYHMPYNKRSAQSEGFKSELLLYNSSYMLEYAITEPNHEAVPGLNDNFLAAIQGVEMGKMTVKEANEFFINNMVHQFGDKITVK